MNEILELDALCEAARQGEDPTDEDRRAVLKALAAKTGVALGTTAALVVDNAASNAGSLAAGTSGTTSLAPAAAIAKGTSFYKGLALFVGLGSASALAVGVHLDEPGPRDVAPSAPSAAPRPVPVVHAPIDEPIPPKSHVENPPEPARPVAPSKTPPRKERTLEAEAAALANIQRALRDGMPERALSLLDAEERAWQGGALAPERAAARVFALCAAGRATEGRRLARRFLAHHPDSPLAERVRESCREEAGAQ